MDSDVAYSTGSPLEKGGSGLLQRSGGSARCSPLADRR